MTIIQEAFYIPNDIVVGLASGAYRRTGGVIRYAGGINKGQIVKHLEPAVLPNEQIEGLSVVEKILQVGMRSNKKLVIAAGVAIAVALGGGIYALFTMRKRTRFQNAFSNYINAIKTGKLSVEIIEDLEIALKNLKTVKLKTTELSILVGYIRDYTFELAENNNIDIEIKEKNRVVIDLKQYLEKQKEILQSA
jgi:hypothetical protein